MPGNINKNIKKITQLSVFWLWSEFNEVNW